METRTTRTTEGKMITFSYDGEYFKPLCRESQEIFDGVWKDYLTKKETYPYKKYAACVLYTKIVRDNGRKEEERWGYPTIVHYDNGNIGYQNMNYFMSIEEARKDLEDRSRLSPKVGVIGYCDVWMAINNNLKK